MKSTRFFLQAAVVASAVLLVGGFVGYRAGAFPWLTEAGTPATEAGSAVDREEAPADLEAILPSSKQAVLIGWPAPPPPAAQAAQTGETPPVFIGGSKSAIFPLFPVPPGEIQLPQAEPPPAPASR